MIQKILRFFTSFTATVLVSSLALQPLSAFASSFAISEAGPYIAVDQSQLMSTSEWRVEVNITPQANSNGTPANASLIFGFIDSNNYYYANVAAQAGTGLNGIHRVQNGVRTTVETYNVPVSAGQSYAVEVRHKSGGMKVYVDGTYLTKVEGVAIANTKVGVGTVLGNATVNSVTLNSTPLTLSFPGSEAGEPPEETPASPAVSITVPTSGITVSGQQTVAANATDDQGITSVQFKVNGTNIGPADTTAPYGVTWDTTLTSEGLHTLTAVATDIEGLATTSAPVSVTVDNVASPPVQGDFTVNAGGPNGGIDTTTSVSGSEWKVESQITATPATGETPANFSIVFGYVDAANFYYANFSESAASGLGGIYKVENGETIKLLGHATLISPNQAYEMEVRYKDGDIRLYLDNTYIIKVEDVTLSGTKVGVAVHENGATFSNTQLDTSSTTVLQLTPTELTLAPPTPDPSQSLPTPSDPVRTPSIGRQVSVSNSAELKAALLDAQPGDTITMADGVYTDSMQVGNYTGSFAITADGTAENPITLTGSPGAVIDGNGTGGRYGLYLAGADYWNLVGFTVANASKGVVQDGSNYVFYEDMTVTNVGAEAIHFRAFSSHNVVKNSIISSTGRNSAQFGEGVYIGSASGANWDIHSGGEPDKSDRNIVIGNTFTDFTAEALDIKEGSTGNYIAHNTFEGSSLSGENSADSWVDVKGNYNLIEYNTGTNTLANGFEVHGIDAAPGWAANNVFRNNTANVNTGGYGFYISFNALQSNNTISCNNTVAGAGAGSWNVACTP